jgi:hypothetical protein
MKMRFAFWLVIAGFGVAPSPIFAHHGLTWCDTEHVTTLKGSVTAFEFVNPHALVHVAVRANGRNVEEWTAETAPPSMLRRAGWDRATLKPGDAITVSGYQAKDGARYMSVRKIVMPNGQVLNQGPR